MIRRLVIFTITLVFGASSPLFAQQAASPEPIETSQRVTIADMDWLIGQWWGVNDEGGMYLESWLPPSNGTMVGTFVQEDADGAIVFTEHMYLTEKGNALELRIKHFDPELFAWEEKEERVLFGLQAIKPCFAKFTGITYRCIDPEDPFKGLETTVQVSPDQALTFRFDPTEIGKPISCRDGTIACFPEILKASEARRAYFLAKAIELRPEISEAIAASDAAFTSYRDASCSALVLRATEPEEEAIHRLGCAIVMTDHHTLTLRQHWLNPYDPKVQSK